MKKILCIPLFAASLAFGAPVLIHFDEQPQLGLTGVVITNQYPGVSFSSSGGSVNYVTTQAVYNSTPPNFICTGPAGSQITCTAETILDFAIPVSNLRFDALGINDSGVVAQVDVFVSGVLDSTLDIVGNAEIYNPLLVDLTSYSDVTRIRMHSITDSAGIGWDTFRYEQAQIPEPSTALLMMIGLALTVAVRRR